jgi:hypothetical protein
MQAALRIVRNGAPPSDIEIAIGRVIVGREVGDIVLGDPQASSRHLELHWDGVRLSLRDLGSTNGTFVAGQRVAERLLAPREVIEIGKSRIEFVGVVGAGRTEIAMPAAGPQGTQVAAPAARAVPVAALPVVHVPAAPKPARQTPPTRSARQPWSMAAKIVAGGGAVLALFVVWVVSVAINRGGAEGTMTNGEATVRAVYFSGTPGVKVEGGTTPIVVRIAKNTTPAVSVGVLEEFAGGTGNMWKTATWQAAFNASRAAGISLVDHEYVVRAGGHIDGPSAGMLITATMLALLNGDAIDPTTTMTGTINPDGSAGPVGGVVQKMQGAKKDGMTRFGYPIGTRSHTDMADGRTVDLEEVGRGLGLEVKEIADLATAYEFLTRVPLRHEAPVDEAEMLVDRDTSVRLQAKLSRWKSRLQAEITALSDRLRKGANADIKRQIDNANTNLARAERYEKSDLPAAALDAYQSELSSLRSTREGIEVADMVIRRDFAGVRARVAAAREVHGRLQAFASELKLATEHASVGGLVNQTNAMTTFVQAQSLADSGDASADAANSLATALNGGQVGATPETINALVMQLLLADLTYLYADILLDRARDDLELVGDEGKQLPALTSAFAREAGGYASAAGATLAYFEALEVEPLTKKGMSMDKAREQVENAIWTYRTARGEVLLAERARGDTTMDQMVRLAAGIDAFLSAAVLVNTYYALGGQRQQDGTVELANRKALSAQLDLARTFAREAAARAKARAGFVPVAARIAYQTAGAIREGSDDDKISALAGYWQSAQWSELAARLAR